MPVQINNEDTLEVSAAEYKAVIDFSARIAEQNAAVLESIKAMTDAMIRQGEATVAAMGAFRDAVKSLQVIANIEQPAPVVNVEQPAESKRKISMKVRRDKDGLIIGVDGQEE